MHTKRQRESNILPVKTIAPIAFLSFFFLFFIILFFASVPSLLFFILLNRSCFHQILIYLGFSHRSLLLFFFHMLCIFFLPPPFPQFPYSRLHFLFHNNLSHVYLSLIRSFSFSISISISLFRVFVS